MSCTRLFDLADSPPVSMSAFRTYLSERSGAGDRLLTLFAEEPDAGAFLLHAVLGGSAPGAFAHRCAKLPPLSFPTLTDICPGTHWFEREIGDLFGIVPEGHPEPKPLRFHEGWPKRFFPLRGGGAPLAEPRRGYRFLAVRGEGIHEVAVGPVHAGIIEPGHFRFSCAGETIQNLEIRLGYQHRGIESLLPGEPGMRQILLSESISGDTAVGHANACARLIEAALCRPPDAATETWRSVALEIERVANHCGDLGGLSTDIGYLFGASHFARLRGTALNLLARVAGNRFARGMNRPGGLGPRVPGLTAAELIAETVRLEAEFGEIAKTMLASPSVAARMEGTGRLLAHTARTLQVVGVVGRASGRDVDARRDFPSPRFADVPIPVVVREEGDVAARARVRVDETLHSLRWISAALSASPCPEAKRSAADATEGRRVLAVSVEEGWRGEIVHAAVLDREGRIARYKVVDPSFRNWPGLSFAVQKNVISDFPLCNKSFNLSYSGADL